MKPIQRFAHNLRDRRRSLAISQEELGYRCGLHRTAISRLEKGDREPEFKTLLKLAAGLETTLTELFAGVGPKGRKSDAQLATAQPRLRRAKSAK